jgi:formiminoglutamase
MIKKSEKGNFHFFQFEKQSIENYFSPRSGETRVGDFDLKNSKAKYVILGIEESIGPQANHGLPGSEDAFESFLRVFLNSQVYPGINMDEVFILGSIKQHSTFSSIQDASEQVYELDEFVFQILLNSINENQIPIVIGGGHNNAYPLIKWSSKKGLVNVLNLDPHADCRKTDRRHSGNSFSYAIDENILNEYVVLGLHEAFNNAFIRDYLKIKNVKHSFYEDYLIGNRSLIEDAIETINSWNQMKQRIGLEIDMDSISNMPSSACSPSGWALDQVRSYLMLISSKIKKTAYLHLPEAGPKNELESKIVGKALTYLVRDFVLHSK